MPIRRSWFPVRLRGIQCPSQYDCGMASDRFPDPRDEPTMTIERASRFFGLSSSAAYDAAARGDIPSMRIGRRIVVPTGRAAQQLGIRFEGLR